MNIPIWIVLPGITPLAVIAAAVALQHLEAIILPPNQPALTDVDPVRGPPTTTGQQ